MNPKPPVAGRPLSASRKTTASPQRQPYAELKKERDQLLLQVAKLQSERALHLKALLALTREEFEIDKQALLAQVGKGQSLSDFIAELEATGSQQ